uniref:Uncharacterized protein n=1 Tax=Schistosoma mansoni TaxID=6183 RepID=A0A5K4F9V6_SCHMA
MHTSDERKIINSHPNPPSCLEVRYSSFVSGKQRFHGLKSCRRLTSLELITCFNDFNNILNSVVVKFSDK